MSYTSLEDLFEDIVGKALRGQALDAREVERRAGLAPGDVAKITGGSLLPNDQRVRALADALGLNGERLLESAHKAWFPKAPDGAGSGQRVGVERVAVRDPMEMNSYIFYDRETREAGLVDPGGQGDRLVATLRQGGLGLVIILLTHGHGDHTGALRHLKRDYDVPAYINANDLPLVGGLSSLIHGGVEDGWETRVGRLNVRAIGLPGHTPGGTGYVTEDVLFSGDALFAGSLGGARSKQAYEAQIQAVRQKALGLPKETTIFPGHGPATTVMEERLHNPFFLT